MKYRIREIRESKGMTAVELAAKSNICRASLWRIEANGTEAKVGTLKRIADALGVGLEELFLPETDNLLDERREDNGIG